MTPTDMSLNWVPESATLVPDIVHSFLPAADSVFTKCLQNFRTGDGYILLQANYIFSYMLSVYPRS